MNETNGGPKDEVTRPEFRVQSRIQRPTCRSCGLVLRDGKPHLAAGACIQALQQVIGAQAHHIDAQREQFQAMTRVLWVTVKTLGKDGVVVLPEDDLKRVLPTAGVQLARIKHPDGVLFMQVTATAGPPDQAAPPSGGVTSS